MDDEYRDEGMDGYEASAADAEADQAMAALREGCPLLTMMFLVFRECGLEREDAATMAVAWYQAS